MPITKEERLARKQQHTKQERISVLDGVPSSDEVREGVPVLRDTNEGLIEYVKHKGVLHATPKGASSSTVTTFASSAVRGSGVDGASPSSGFSGDHGDLTGLSDDDHTIYILVDGTRAFSGRAIVDDTTDATSKTDGSLQTDGGLSVAKAIYNGTAATLAADSGVVTIGSTTAATFSAAGLLNVNNATEATSTTDGSLQTDGGLSVVKSVVIGDDLDLLSNSTIFKVGSDQPFTLTHANANNTLTATANHRLAFGDAGEYIYGDGTDMKIISSGDVDMTATLFDVTGAITASGIIKTDDATEATSTTDGSLQTDGGLSVVKDAIFGNDVKLLTNASVFSMGVGSDFTITHDNTTGATLAASPITINSTGDMTLDSTTDIILDAAGDQVYFKDNGTTRIVVNLDGSPEMDVTGNFTIDGSATITLDSVGNFIVKTDASQRFKVDTGGHAYFHNFEGTFTGGEALFNDYKINNLADNYHFVTAFDDLKQNYVLLAEDTESAAGTFNPGYGS